MSKKYYVVWKGVKTGVFSVWSEVKANIDGRSDAQYMGFPSEQEARQAFASTYTKALMKRSLAKGGKPQYTNTPKQESSFSSSSNKASDLTNVNVQIYYKKKLKQ